VGTPGWIMGLFYGKWSAPKGFGDGNSTTDITTNSFTSVTIWNSASTRYANTCNTIIYDDTYAGSSTSDAGKIYLWFKGPPGSYTISVQWEVSLQATGSNGRAECVIKDVININEVANDYVLTDDSPLTDSGTYNLNVTTTDDDWHVVLYYDPTLNFGNRSPAHADTGTAEGRLIILSVTKN
jgi:hypothetical protein